MATVMALVSTAAARAPQRNACALITKAEASRILGAPVIMTRSTRFCGLRWSKPGNEGGGELTVVLDFPGGFPFRQNSLRDLQASGYKITKLTGLGPGAFAATSSASKWLFDRFVFAVGHGWVFQLRRVSPAYQGYPDLSATLAQMIGLTRVAYRRL